MPDKIMSLWIKYKEHNDIGAKDELIIHYVEMVKHIAGRLFSEYNRNVEFDDLLSYGIIGLIDAIEKFDIHRNIKFETYANLRVRGAIVDELRTLDWIPRSMRKKYSDVEKATHKLQMERGANFTDADLAKELGITEAELSKLMGEISTFAVVSLEEKFEEQSGFDVKANDDNMSPEMLYEKREQEKQLKSAILELNEKEQLVVSMYYYDELTYKEIGKALSISESRISQIHTSAIAKLNAKMR